MRTLVFLAVAAAGIAGQWHVMKNEPPAPSRLPVYHYGSIYPEVRHAALDPSLIVPRALDELFHPGETVDPRSSIVDAAQRRVDAHGGSLTAAELQSLLELAGWPQELIPQAMAVSWCESRWSPYAVGDSGASLGLFQLWGGWLAWAGYEVEQFSDIHVHAAAALRVVQRDIALGRDPWTQWTCKPQPGPQ